MLISSAEIELTLCHLSNLETDAPLELLRDALLFGPLLKWKPALESGKPRRDLSTIA